MHRLLLVFSCVTLAACPGDDTGSDGMGSSGSGTASGSDSTASPPTTTSEPDTSGTTAEPPVTTGDTTAEPPGDSSESSGGPPLKGDVLQNDSWDPTQQIFWNEWPNTNDCWASVYEADAAQYPFEIVGAIVAIGQAMPSPGVVTFEIGVWEVDGTGMPTNEIDTRTVDVDGAAVDFTEVDLSGLTLPTIDSGQFALVMCHTEHMGAPSIATDSDGNVDGSRNWVFQQAMGDWVPSPDFFGIDGDFIMRAVIMPN